MSNRVDAGPSGSASGDGEPADRNAGWRDNELARRRRLRSAAQRPLGQNLAQGIALSEFLSTFTGSARLAGRPIDAADVEALETAHTPEGGDPAETA